MELFPFLIKRLLMNLFQGQFVPFHYASLLCIVLHEKSMPTYADKRYLLLLFSASKKNCHRHVNGFGDIPFISLVCNRAKSSKKTLFHTIRNLGKGRWGWGEGVSGHAHLFYKSREKEDGIGGVGVNGHAHRYVLILPAKRVFLFFKVKTSLGDDSSSRRFTFGQPKCLVEQPA